MGIYIAATFEKYSNIDEARDKFIAFYVPQLSYYENIDPPPHHPIVLIYAQ